MLNNPDFPMVGASAKSEKTESKPWSERIKSANNSIASYFSKYGTSTGLAGGTLLIMGGAAAMMGAVTATTPEAVETARTASSTLIMGGILKIGAMSIAEHVAKLHLHGVDSLFDGSEDTSPDMVDEIRAGASKIDDPVLKDPHFQKAVVETFKDLQSDPETRSQVVEMLSNSPEARRALMNAQKQIDATADLKQQVADLPTSPYQNDSGPESEGPVLH
ncbi:hypothetical protein [Marinobacter salarius]|uniref:Uncharacterized protein n=1 Tax=Marinobacter salarius TaxID=1420917 RepID=A0A1W6KFJ6_9GAMM|nr:hypothetical protein [Marinobacter salarius]ARM86215.1 hypothetical protein MARSALSMR5_04195 [Marinobacter salarius]